MTTSKAPSRVQQIQVWILPVLLALPAITLVVDVATTEWSKRFYHGLMATSGETGVRLLLLSLVATPLLRAWPRFRFAKWLRKRRRTFGVAAFAYGVLHFSFYCINETPPDMLWDLAKPFYIAGWLGLLLMVPLALTSTRASQRRLKKRWTRLHKIVYVVALAVAVHWMLKKGSPVSPTILIHFAPLLALQAYRWQLQKKT